jgi:hypothetical protein
MSNHTDTELVYLIINLSGTIDFYSYHELEANRFNEVYCNGDAIVKGSFETEAALKNKMEIRRGWIATFAS